MPLRAVVLKLDPFFIQSSLIISKIQNKIFDNFYLNLDNIKGTVDFVYMSFLCI